MSQKAGSGRDAFAFSLRGMTTIASFTAPTVIADDRLNRIRDERAGRPLQDQPDTARAIEDALGRYFAPGRCRAA